MVCFPLRRRAAEAVQCRWANSLRLGRCDSIILPSCCILTGVLPKYPEATDTKGLYRLHKGDAMQVSLRTWIFSHGEDVQCRKGKRYDTTRHDTIVKRWNSVDGALRKKSCSSPKQVVVEGQGQEEANVYCVSWAGPSAENHGPLRLLSMSYYRCYWLWKSRNGVGHSSDGWVRVGLRLAAWHSDSGLPLTNSELPFLSSCRWPARTLMVSVATNNPTARSVRRPREIPCDKDQAKSPKSRMVWNKAQQPPHEACS